MDFKRSSGILLHPTSLPGNYGIGDIGFNAYRFIDFLKEAGQSLWQILPLGPTSFGDSPYQSFSTFAGNPMLISPGILCKKGYLTQADLEKAPDFPALKTNYSKALPYKNTLLHKAYDAFCEKSDNEEIAAFLNFKAENSHWLDDYALFAALKDYFIAKRQKEGYSKHWETFRRKTTKLLSENLQKDYYFGAVWSTWPDELIAREPDTLVLWRNMLCEEIEYYEYLQYEFFSQWHALKDYANNKGIQIIGDIPIFVAYDSADVWSCTKNYYIDFQGFPSVVAGVPPDYFSSTGQLWGNPLYNWAYHEKTGYKWWIQRIKACLSTVDIVRIDHFRAFESYWEIPAGDIDATGGKWCKGPGDKLFKAIKESLGDLPIIAEDLGIITQAVTDLRLSLGFPGMKVLQFAFSGGAENLYLPHAYEKNAVVYTGTHDNDTTLGWYKSASPHEQDHCRRYMNVDGQNISWDFLRLAVASAATTAIFPFQDVLSLDSSARMNTPSTPSGNWQFRFTWEQVPNDAASKLHYLNQLFNRLPPKENLAEIENTEYNLNIEE